jgi:ankyrin repeat protein
MGALGRVQDGMTVLMIAAREGHAPLVRLLLTSGADATLRNAVRAPRGGGRVQ